MSTICLKKSLIDLVLSTTDSKVGLVKDGDPVVDPTVNPTKTRSYVFVR